MGRFSHYSYAGSCDELRDRFDLDVDCCQGHHADIEEGYSAHSEVWDDENEKFYLTCRTVSAAVSDADTPDYIV